MTNNQTVTLSVVVATFNEEENLERCLNAIKSIADEIVIVDGGSTDQTIRISRSYGAIIVQTSNPSIFHINKQKGLDKAKGEWILQLDADEVVSPKLAREIVQTISQTDQQRKNKTISSTNAKLFTRHQHYIEKRDGNFFDIQKPIAGYFVPRSNLFLGKVMRYAGMYPDGVIRLVKKNHAHFPCQSVHEQIQIDGNVAWLENDLIHYDSPTFKKYISRANRYTTLTAKEMKLQAIPISWKSHLYYLVIKPSIVFLKLYFRHKGFIDGFPGFVFSLFSGLHFSLAYMKYATKEI